MLPGAVLVVLGFWALLRTGRMRPWRSLGIAAVLVTLVLLAAGGRQCHAEVVGGDDPGGGGPAAHVDLDQPAGGAAPVPRLAQRPVDPR